jgi:hypothetical protein
MTHTLFLTFGSALPQCLWMSLTSRQRAKHEHTAPAYRSRWEESGGASLAMESIPQSSRGVISGLLQAGYPSGYLLASIAYGLFFTTPFPRPEAAFFGSGNRLFLER